mgnify:CR=1 FL=1
MSGELPAGWTHFSLKSLGGLSGGKTPSKANSDFWSSSDVPWVSPKDMKKDLLNDSEDKISQTAMDKAGMVLYQTGSVLMVTRSGILQHTFPVALTGADMTVNQDIKVLRPNEGISPKLSFYMLKSFGQEILSACAKGGTTVQSIDTEKLEAFPLPLPPSAEQTRIAQKLDELLAQVDTLKARIDAIPALLKRFRQSVLAAAVSGRLTADWRAENTRIDLSAQINKILSDRSLSSKSKKVPASHLTNEEYEIPDTWRWVSLDSLAAKIVDGTHHTPTYMDHGVPFISVKDIRYGVIDFTNTKFITTEEHAELCKRCHPEKGDLLITKSGTIGRTAIIPRTIEFSLFVSVALIKPASMLVNMHFINIALMKWVDGIDVSSRIVGSAIKNLHLTDMKVLAIPFAPLEEQAEIVRRVEQLFAFTDQLEAKIKTAQARVNHLTQSILAKAFRGELVPQDPSDEPASVLLARIQTQRAAAPKTKRGKKP